MIPTRTKVCYWTLLGFIQKNYNRLKISRDFLNKEDILNTSIFQYEILSAKSKFYKNLNLEEKRNILENFINENEKIYETDLKEIVEKMKNEIDDKTSFIRYFAKNFKALYFKGKKVDKLKRKTLKELID